MGWLAGWLIASKEAVRSAYVLPGGDDEGWMVPAGTGEERGETAESQQRWRGTEQEALNVRWINLDEGDDIAASKFLCGGQVVAA